MAVRDDSNMAGSDANGGAAPARPRPWMFPPKVEFASTIAWSDGGITH
jgi:hypothetical protein